MEKLTKVKIDLKHGIIELEGSEEFVEKHLNNFMDGTLKKWKIEEDKEVKTLDSDIINVGMGKSQLAKAKALREIIREIQDEFKGSAPLKEIISRAEKSGIKKDTVEDMIHKLKCAGELIETSENSFKVF